MMGSVNMSFEHMKYRVWDRYAESDDGKEGVMFAGDSHYALLPNGSILMECGDDGWDECSSKGLVVMRSTGIKDSTGKLVYEGDILDIYNWGHPRESQELLHRAEVAWNVDEHEWDLHPYFDCDSYDRFRNVKIVGNIHENPELLTGRAGKFYGKT
jgi:hypothetical protein